MYTTIDETGRLNNYAVEPKPYLASYPTAKQQRRYFLQGGLATLLVATLMLVAVTVS